MIGPAEIEDLLADRADMALAEGPRESLASASVPPPVTPEPSSQALPYESIGPFPIPFWFAFLRQPF